MCSSLFSAPFVSEGKNAWGIPGSPSSQGWCRRISTLRVIKPLNWESGQHFSIRFWNWGLRLRARGGPGIPPLVLCFRTARLAFFFCTVRFQINNKESLLVQVFNVCCEGKNAGRWVSKQVRCCWSGSRPRLDSVALLHPTVRLGVCSENSEEAERRDSSLSVRFRRLGSSGSLQPFRRRLHITYACTQAISRWNNIACVSSQVY